MKYDVSLVTAAAALVILASASQSQAQYRPTGDDGITASPKARQFLNERKPAVKADVSSMQVSTIRTTWDGSITASPKAHEILAKRVAVPATSAGSELASRDAGYQPTGADGVTASPKMREALNERGTATFQIAPIK